MAATVVYVELQFRRGEYLYIRVRLDKFLLQPNYAKRSYFKFQTYLEFS